MDHSLTGGKKTPDEKAAVNEKDSGAKQTSRESLIYLTACPDIILHRHNGSFFYRREEDTGRKGSCERGKLKGNARVS
jgi:hypothetical protein